MNQNKRQPKILDRKTFKLDMMKKVNAEKTMRVKEILEKWKEDDYFNNENTEILNKSQDFENIESENESFQSFTDEKFKNIIKFKNQDFNSNDQILNQTNFLKRNNDETITEMKSKECINIETTKQPNLQGLINDEFVNVDGFSQLRDVCSGVFTGNLVSQKSPSKAIYDLYDNENACLPEFKDHNVKEDNKNPLDLGLNLNLDFSGMINVDLNKLIKTENEIKVSEKYNINKMNNSIEEDSQSQKSITLIDDKKLNDKDDILIVNKKHINKFNIKKKNKINNEYEKFKQKLFYTSSSRNFSNSLPLGEYKDDSTQDSSILKDNKSKSILNSIVFSSFKSTFCFF